MTNLGLRSPGPERTARRQATRRTLSIQVKSTETNKTTKTFRDRRTCSFTVHVAVISCKRDDDDVARGDGERGVLTATGRRAGGSGTQNRTLTTSVPGFGIEQRWAAERYATEVR